MTNVAALLRPPAWTGLQWPGARVVIIASGESLTGEQCEAARAWRFAETAETRRVIVINTSYQAALWADVLYACDSPWWELYSRNCASRKWEPFPGSRWTQDPRVPARLQVNYIESTPGKGLGRRPGLIHQGGNSAYQSMNLAYQAGAKRLVLLGCDMRGGHWHGPHPDGLPNTPPAQFGVWLRHFAHLADDLEAEGVEVVNCTPGSALNVFPMASLEETLT